MALAFLWFFVLMEVLWLPIASTSVGRPNLIGSRCSFLPIGSRCCALPKNWTLFERESALTDAMVARGIIDTDAMGSTATLLAALERGTEPVRLFVAGGSFTRGNGCTQNAITTFKNTPEDADQVCAEGKTWALQLAESLKARFQADVQLDFYGLGSTTTHYGYKLFRDADAKLANLGLKYDLVMFDYSCNDVVDSSSVRFALETVARICFQRGITFVLLRSCPADKVDQSERQYASVAKLYKFPLLSYKMATLPEAPSPFWDAPALWAVHPGCSARHFVAEFVAKALVVLSSPPTLSTNNPSSSSLLRALPRPEFGAPEDMDALLIQRDEACFPKSTELVWFTQKTHTAAITEKQPVYYNQSWGLRRDGPAHTLGWIAESSSNYTEENEPAAWLAFEIELVAGAVTISYLETFHNAGVLEVWVASKPSQFSSNGGIRGCKLSPTNAYKSDPHQPLRPPTSPWFTESTFIDTYVPGRTTSQIRERTIDFKSHGTHMLNIRHSKLPQSERDKRGGDKVKVAAVRSC